MHSLFRCVLLVLVALTCFVLAKNEPIPPKDWKTNLGIALNSIKSKEPDTGNPLYVVYTSVLKYGKKVNGPVKDGGFSDEQLAGLAQQAWNEAMNLHNTWIDDECPSDDKNLIATRRPTMLSVIAADQYLFISTSFKANKPNIMLKAVGDGEKQRALTRGLQMALNDQQNERNQPPLAGDPDDPDSPTNPNNYHGNGGSCAEIAATGLCLKLTGDFPWTLETTGLQARIVAWGNGNAPRRTVRGRKLWGNVVNPCQAPYEKTSLDSGGPSTPDPKANAIGCKQFVEWAKLKPIPEGVIPEQVDVPYEELIEVSLEDVVDIIVPRLNVEDGVPKDA